MSILGDSLRGIERIHAIHGRKEENHNEQECARDAYVLLVRTGRRPSQNQLSSLLYSPFSARSFEDGKE